MVTAEDNEETNSTTKIYADLDAVQNAVVSSSLGACSELISSTSASNGLHVSHHDDIGGTDSVIPTVVALSNGDISVSEAASASNMAAEAAAAAAAAAAATTTFMQWEYLDANTIRTYEIPVHIGPR